MSTQISPGQPVINTVLEWEKASGQQRAAALARPKINLAAIDERVDDLIRRVRTGGDTALYQLVQSLDRSPAGSLWVTPEEFDSAARQLPDDLQDAIQVAYQRIREWHRQSVPSDKWSEAEAGCLLGTVYRPIQNVGLYVPAGSAPLPSTALMLGVPAQVAGNSGVVMATPANAEGLADPATLFAARLCGIERVLKAGGAHAVAAMAYGTESVPKVDKIFGPGNTWVTRAKQRVALDAEGAACDLPAGPSEVMVVADGGARVEWIAADLLSQAEHGPDSQVLAVLMDAALVPALQQALASQLESLPRRDIASRALSHARIILAPSMDDAMSVINEYAPEHLILHVEQARDWLGGVRAAGSVFLGAYSPESAGDYASGTNHVLPTGGFARACSGLSVTSFMNAISVQQLSPSGLRELAPSITSLARWEGLEAHARAVTLRIDGGQ